MKQLEQKQRQLMNLRKKLKDARASVNRSQASARSFPDKIGGGSIANFYTSAEKDNHDSLPPKISKTRKASKNAKKDSKKQMKS